MKEELSTLDLFYMTQELQKILESRVHNAYHPDGIYIQLHKTGTGKLLLRIEPGIVWLTKSKPEMPQKVSGFCNLLRKLLKGLKVKKVEQVDGERVLLIEFEKQETYKLYVELFAQGNIILCGSDDTIKKALHERAWKDRTIKKGEKYKLPPRKKNILELTPKDFDLKIKDNLSAELATTGFGSTYAKEICKRAEVDALAKKISKEQQKKLYAAYNSLLNDMSGAIVYKDGEITPFKLEQKENEGTKFDSFSEAIDSKHKVKALKKDTATKKYEKQKEKILKLIKMQEQSANKNETEAALNQQKGEFIYEHYQELKKILQELKKIKEKHSMQEMKKKLKGHNMIKDVNVKTQDVVVEIEE